MRALLTRRWILFALVVIGFAYLAFRLGEWQHHRLETRRASNAQTETNLAAKPVPATTVMSVGSEPAQADEWRTVRATGAYDDSGTVLIRYQTRNGQLGVDVVTPLVLDDGTAVVVDRGWMSTPPGPRPTPPAPPSGSVTVTGWVRIDGTGGSTVVTDASARAISSIEIAKTLSYPVRSGFIDLQSESASGAGHLVPAERPSLSDGPHLIYWLQWWTFAVMAIGGFAYLFWDERRKARSEGAEKPSVDGERGAADE